MLNVFILHKETKKNAKNAKLVRIEEKKNINIT